MHCSINNTQVIGTARETLFPEKFVENDIRPNGSWFMIALNDESLIIDEEQYFYDFNSFLGEVGGSLGLFLGISFFTLYEWSTSILERLFKHFIVRKQCK